MGGLRASTADLRRLLRVVDPERCGEPGDELPDSLLTDLAELIPCDEVTVTRLNPARRVWLQQTLGQLPQDPPEVQALGWASIDAGERSDTVWYGVDQEQSSDPVHGPLARRYHAAFLDFVGATAYTELTVYLPAEGLDHGDVSLLRLSGTRFNEREQMLAWLLRPQLVALNHLHRLGRAGLADLTQRQLEVLRLVAVGQSNHQISRALRVSEGTVRKHLENAYERLQVTSRTEAVARARDLLWAG
jgi:DNA-binding CsgD family transcriptional regulator